MGQSLRTGGVSNFPYKSLNLGLNTQDEIHSVNINRQIFFDALKIFSDQVVGGLQVHDDLILEVNSGGYHTGYDAFVSQEKGLYITIGVADCTPILIFDSVSLAIGAAHAGHHRTAPPHGRAIAGPAA